MVKRRKGTKMKKKKEKHKLTYRKGENKGLT